VGRPYAIGALGLAYGRVAIAEKGALRAPGNTGGGTLTPVVEWFFGRAQDEMPVDESHWIVVNPCAQSLQDTLYKLNTDLLGATISGSALRFDSWLNQKMPQLQPLGVLTA
jgi:hypothetical protein